MLYLGGMEKTQNHRKRLFAVVSHTRPWRPLGEEPFGRVVEALLMPGGFTGNGGTLADAVMNAHAILRGNLIYTNQRMDEWYAQEWAKLTQEERRTVLDVGELL